MDKKERGVKKIFCDECETEDGVGRVTIDVARSTPITIPSGTKTKFDKDLCQICANKLFAALDTVLE
jgi:hypothetical protein